MWSPLLALLLCGYFSGSQANRVYVHPFHLFAAENVSCETLQTQTSKPLETLPVAPLDVEVLTPDSRDPSKVDAQRQNITERTAVLAELLNSLGLRMYQAMSKQHSTNTLLSPVNTFGSLATLYLGASKKTASVFQLLLGLSSGADQEDCVFLLDGHKVLKTLQGINSPVDDGPKDEITTQVWTFTRQDAQLSEDFIQGTQDVSDTSFIRGVDFSKPQEAEQLVNSFMEKTSDGRVKNVFRDLNSGSDLLFVSSFNFQGNWRTAFQPEKTSMQEFHLDNTTTVMAPLMTHTGQYHYLNDKEQRCTVVKLSLSKRSYMLLVLPHEGVNLNDIESKLLTNVMSDWHQSLQEGLLELSLPKFSMISVSDLHDLLTNMDPEIEAKLLGSEAEFSQLSNIKPFTIDKAVNKVSFEMSDDGAELQDKIQEAGVILKLSINRPFFFSVIEEGSNAILMLGKITNPTL
ncbi:LOW QUALITY PROTEIN: angiotensinogen [Cottoperca gobio]|uniref:Angiotensinogen n=1 Tax=Cottoperca gobio TaxID=56716 RepID=A0A6J2R5G8_COTGO|nr:LOW QUALITY PROTEIN: angiotensinogen [Cottoperca gobio]